MCSILTILKNPVGYICAQDLFCFFLLRHDMCRDARLANLADRYRQSQHIGTLR